MLIEVSTPSMSTKLHRTLFVQSLVFPRSRQLHSQPRQMQPITAAMDQSTNLTWRPESVIVTHLLKAKVEKVMPKEASVSNAPVSTTESASQTSWHAQLTRSVSAELPIGWCRSL